MTGCSRMKKDVCESSSDCAWTKGKGCYATKKTKRSSMKQEDKTKIKPQSKVETDLNPKLNNELIQKVSMKKVFRMFHPDSQIASTFSDASYVFLFKTMKYILRGAKKEFHSIDIRNGFDHEDYSELSDFFHREGKAANSRNDAIFNHPKFAYQVECVLGKKLADRKACLTLAAGLEYLYAQLCDYSGQIARDAGKKRITSDHLYQMIESDPEMKILAKKIRF